MDIPICLSAKSFCGTNFRFRENRSQTLAFWQWYFAFESRLSRKRKPYLSRVLSSDRKIKNYWKKSNFLVNKQQTDWFPTLTENQQRWRIWLLTRHRPEVAFVFFSQVATCTQSMCSFTATLENDIQYHISPGLYPSSSRYDAWIWCDC